MGFWVDVLVARSKRGLLKTGRANFDTFLDITSLLLELFFYFFI
jgi:hypothetical protein